MNKCDKCKKKFIVLQRVGTGIFGAKNAPYICKYCYGEWAEFYERGRIERDGAGISAKEWTEAFLSWFNPNLKEKVIFT